MNYDRYGHCCSCHKNMLIDEVVGGKIIQRWTADYDESEYLLNDGSKMRVTICKQCQAQGKHLDTKDIMDKVIRGWKSETDILVLDENKPDWTKEKQEKHMATYSKREIVTFTEGKDEEILKEHLDSFTKVKELKGEGIRDL